MCSCNPVTWKPDLKASGKSVAIKCEFLHELSHCNKVCSIYYCVFVLGYRIFIGYRSLLSVWTDISDIFGGHEELLGLSTKKFKTLQV